MSDFVKNTLDTESCMFRSSPMSRHVLWELLMLLLLLFGATVEGVDVTLGMMSPFKHVRLGWANNAAAATIAMERAEREGLLHNITVHIHWEDDQCTALGGTSKAVVLWYNYSVDAFIGPPCSSATKTAGLLATYWNMPMFSSASSDPSLADKVTYRTLVRLGPPFNRMGAAFVKIFNHFGWDRVVIATRRKVNNKDVFCDYASRATANTFQLNNMYVAYYAPIPDDPTDADIDKMLKNLREHGRIIILCTENRKSRRQILLRAHASGMLDDGNYVFFMPDHLPPSDVRTPWAVGEEDDDIVKEAYRHAFEVTVAHVSGEEMNTFRDDVAKKMAEPPWNYNATFLAGERGSLYSAFLHDAVYLYFLVLNETIGEGLNYRDGQLLFKKATNRSFVGETGIVKLDEKGDRLPAYWLWRMPKDKDAFDVALEVRAVDDNDTQEVIALQEIHWLTVDGRRPTDVPACGFYNEKCPSNEAVKITIIALTFFGVFLIVIAIFFCFKRLRLERQLGQMLWKVDYDDIVFNELTTSEASVSSRSLFYPLVPDSAGAKNLFTTVAVYRGLMVAIKRLPPVKVAIHRAEKLHLKTVLELRHENILPFIGLCIDLRYPCILTAYCNKGSLQDIIGNDDIKLDWTFKISLILDLVNGMKYLHRSPLHYHGRLKSSHCLVDNRWTLKVSGFGMHFLGTAPCIAHDVSRCQWCQSNGLLWTAPEVLRHPHRVHKMTVTELQKADVYSFGIILYEMMFRTYPFDTTDMTPEAIVERIKNKEYPPFRPLVPKDTAGGEKSDEVPEETIRMLNSFWAENPVDRPPFSAIKTQVLVLNKGKNTGIVDNVLMKLEKYANNLENLVEQRTSLLIEERKKSDMLLYSMLPRVVAEKLKAGDRVQAEFYEEVTICFSDIVSFTVLASSLSPMEVVDLLNDLYTNLDSILALHDVYKVETIGDAYMVVSGIPVRNEHRHASEIASMALDFLHSITSFRVNNRPQLQLTLRLGIHTGPCAAGVVGLKMPRYCLFGDTVNMASRMESTGLPMKIQMSQKSREILGMIGRYVITYRDTIHVKGKGLQKTYWLEGKQTLEDAGTTEVDPK